jgi:hypothetical protein
VIELVLLLFATFWAWETLRAIVETLAPRVFALSRPVHPIVAALLPLYVLWPDWVPALAVAGICGLLVAVVDRVMTGPAVAPVPIPRRRSSGGLPPLP